MRGWVRSSEGVDRIPRASAQASDHLVEPPVSMTEESIPKVPRQRQILEALARMLERRPGERITTAALAREVGISEAALYRHFPSKAKMFEALLVFIEDTVFTRIGLILSEEPGAVARCERILGLLLGFSARNPGISRLLAGDALIGESARLRARVGQFYARIETQLKQVLREGESCEGLQLDPPPAASAALLLAVVEGRLNQFVRSGFKRLPMEQWAEQWQPLTRALFGPERR